MSSSFSTATAGVKVPGDLAIETEDACPEVELALHVSFASSGYLERAEALRSSSDRASLIYAALELRCGVEARMKEYAGRAIGISNAQLKEWEIKKLGRTLTHAFGPTDTIRYIRLRLVTGQVADFLYAPVTTRLQEIGKACGDYLHAIKSEFVDDESYWTRLREMLHEGCGLLRLACAGEVLRPTIEHGLHIELPQGDSREKLIEELQRGVAGEWSILEIHLTGPTIYCDK